MFALLLVFSLVTSSMGSSALGFGVRADLLSQLMSQISARVQQTVANEHPAPVSPTSQVTFSNFQFQVVLQSFKFGSNATGWQYFEQDVSFNYHVSDIISESGTIYIFTTNQNHKSLTVDAELNLSTPTPSINVVSSSVNVEQGDLFIVGVCSDTICLIPMSSIIDPIAQQYFPLLQKGIQTAVQNEGTALLARLKTVFKVQVGAGSTLEFDEEGMIDVLSDGSLAYLADGVTLVSQNGNFVSPPVANSGSIDDSFVEKNEISIALSPYFFSSIIWALGQAGELKTIITSAPSSSPIQLTTNNLFFKGAMPGIASYPNNNLTMSLGLESVWTFCSVNTSGLSCGPSVWLMSFSIVNQSGVVVADAVSLNLTMSIDLLLAASVVSDNKVSLQLSIANHQSSIALVQSKIGAVNIKAFDVLITFAFALAKLPPILVSIPSDLTISSVSVSTGPGYFVLGFDGSISLPPAEWMVKRAVKAPLKFSKKSNSTRIAFATKESSFNGTQLCGDGSSASCPQGSTCCYGSTEPFACCPLDHGTCCSQLGYCCPNGQGCTSDNPPQCQDF